MGTLRKNAKNGQRKISLKKLQELQPEIAAIARLDRIT